MCNCIEKVKHKLESQYGNVELDVLVMYDMNFNIITTEVPLRYKYKKKKSDGILESRYTRSEIVGSYCAFCGKQIPRSAK